MTWRAFWVRLIHLSPNSIYRRITANLPIELSGEHAAAFIDTI
ncbi:hypothetical protein AB0I81_40230 [Nonomuraea sp. NPDC050404]